MRDRGARIRGVFVGVFVAVSVFGAGSAAGSDEAVQKARDLYANAAYEDALSLLASLESPEARQYRALCLLALSRSTEAEREIVSLVSAAPTFAVRDDELPPRIAALFRDVRRRVIPAVVRQLFADGRRAFQAKDLPAAQHAFQRVVELTDDPVLRDLDGMSDLHLLAEGFIDLGKTAPTNAAAVRTMPSAPAPGGAGATPPDTGALLTPAVAVRQVVPRWPARLRPPANDIAAAVKIVIGRDGTVTQASMVSSVHPMFDRELLNAARKWVFRPAEWKGSPIESEKVISVTVTRP